MRQVPKAIGQNVPGVPAGKPVIAYRAHVGAFRVEAADLARRVRRVAGRVCAVQADLQFRRVLFLRSGRCHQAQIDVIVFARRERNARVQELFGIVDRHIRVGSEYHVAGRVVGILNRQRDVRPRLEREAPRHVSNGTDELPFPRDVAGEKLAKDFLVDCLPGNAVVRVLVPNEQTKCHITPPSIR